MTDPTALIAEEIARAFHEEYENLAPTYGYETRPESATFWEAVPERNKRLMIHVVGNLLARKIIERGRFGPVPQTPTLRGRGG